jgi:hypothetical protein
MWSSSPLNRDYRSSGCDESSSNVARCGRQFLEKEILGKFAVPLEQSLDSFEDMKPKPNRDAPRRYSTYVGREPQSFLE